MISSNVQFGDSDGVAIAFLGEGLLEIGIDRGQAQPDLTVGYGGDVANSAVMAARLGCRSRLIGCVGADAAGEILLDFWREVGIDTTALDIRRESTGIYLNHRMRRSFTYYRAGSAGSKVSPDLIGLEEVAGCRAVLTSAITSAISPSAAAASVRLIELGRENGALTAYSLNIRPRLNPDPEAVLSIACTCDIVFASNEDLEALASMGVVDAEYRLAAAVPEFVLSAGSAGAQVSARGLIHDAAPISVDVVNATGAGDALAGAYLARRVSGSSLEEAIRDAVTAASFSCGRAGCAGSYPTAAELNSAVAKR